MAEPTRWAGYRGALIKQGRRLAVILLPLCLLLGHVLGGYQLSLISRLDALLYDTRLRLTLPGSLDERVVIVDIDEKSLAEVGHWPWGRDQLALLTQRLFDQYGISALGFDVLFSEADTSSGLHALQALVRHAGPDDPLLAQRVQQLVPQLNYDHRFAQVLQGRPVVLGYYFTSDREGRRKGVLPAPVLSSAGLPAEGLQVLDWDGYGASLAELAAAAPLAGFFNSVTDEDGMVRSLPLVAHFEGRYYESLALGLYRAAKGLPQVVPLLASAQAPPVLEALGLIGPGLQQRIPVDERGTTLIPFRGAGGPRGGSYRYLSAVDVLQGRVDAAALRGRIVLVGSTSPGLLDLRATPVGQTYPGVESHANVVSGLLDQRLAVRPDYALGYEVLMLIGVATFLALTLPRVGAVAALALGVVTLLGVIGLNLALYQAGDLVLPLASTLLLVLLVLAGHMSYGYLVESRAKRRLAGVFGTYVPPELVDQMLLAPERYSMRAASCEMTVMFCDMRGFTRLSEGLSPEALQDLLNSLFSRLTLCIRRHQGTIDKYMGDCVMAFWGAPVVQADHAVRAVAAALDMVAEVALFNQERQAQGLSPIAVGIGLNTGIMRVGDMGSDLRRSYTVIGDAVNLASRLEGLSKLYGVSIVASESTRAQADTTALWQALDWVRVQGKEDAVAIFCPWPSSTQGLAASLTEDQAKAWDQFLLAYRVKDWAVCQQMLENLQNVECLVGVCQLFKQRLLAFSQHLPAADWDGVTVLDTK